MKSESLRARGSRAVLTFALVALAAGATSFVLFPVFSGGRDARPMLEIHEPRAWAAEATEPIQVGPTRSVAISGMVRHSAPILEVRLNGRRLATTYSDAATTVQFSGFFDARDLRADGTIEVEARGLGDTRTVRLFPVTVSPRPEPGPDFEEVDRGERSQRWAVVIGAGSHADPRFDPTPRAAADARAVADFLGSPAAGLGGFEADHVRVLLDEEATARNIRSALKTFLRTATPGDLVVIFLAGRAAPDPGRPGRAYLLAYDTDAADLPATGVDLRFLLEAVEEVYGHTRVVVADLAVEAGARELVEELLLDRPNARQGGLAVMVPADGGPLTPRLVAGLRGPADADRDGLVRIEEMMAYAGGRVSLTSYDRVWPMATVQPTTTAAAAPARAPGR